MAEERDRKWTALRLRGLRKRWIVNTILPVLVLLVLLVTLVSAGVPPTTTAVWRTVW